MRFLDFEDDCPRALKANSRNGEYRIKASAVAQKHKDDVLRLIGKLSVNPKDYVIGHDYVNHDAFSERALRLCAFDERPTYEYRMRQIFNRSWIDIMFGDGNPSMYGIDSKSFTRDLRDLPSCPAIYFCCQSVSGEAFDLWYIG